MTTVPVPSSSVARSEAPSPGTLWFRYAVLAILTGALVAALAGCWWTVERAGRFFSFSAGLEFDVSNTWDDSDRAQPRRTGRLVVTAVEAGSAAARAGFQVGDTVVAVNGRTLKEAPGGFFGAMSAPGPRARIEMGVRPKASASPGSKLTRVLRPPYWQIRNLQLSFGEFLIQSAPLDVVRKVGFLSLFAAFTFFVVGAFVGWLRARDSTAFLTSAAFLALAVLTMRIDLGLALWPDWALLSVRLLKAVSIPVAVGGLVLMLSTFPTPTRLGGLFLARWWVWILLPAPWAIRSAWNALARVLGWPTQGILQTPVGEFFGTDDWLIIPVLAGVGSLLVAQRLATRAQPQARFAVIEFGIACLLLAGLLNVGIGPVYEVAPKTWKPALDFVLVVVVRGLFAALPISLAYAVLTRRVFGIRFILRRGLQHLFLSRGAVLLEGVVIFFVVQQLLAQGGAWAAKSTTAAGSIAVGSALLGVAVASRVNRRIMPVIDRRFFKDIVDARKVLMGLSEELSRVRDREAILERTASTVLGALHPERVVVLLREADSGRLRGAVALQNARCPTRGGGVALAAPTLELHEDDPIPARLTEGEPWVAVSPDELLDGGEPQARLRALNCELLIALRRGSRLTGLLALGPKLSEEAYSREDRELLLTVAREMAMALENAELLEVAKREARQARELEIAQQVQRDLLPRALPEVPGWEFAALCRPAREVGGDYYDLFEAGPGLVAFALGDVSGKGVGPALLMASVHAIVRSRLRSGPHDLVALVRELNDYLVAASAPGMFITIFVGLLEVATGRLRYVNAGHLAPLVFGREGREPSRLDVGGAMVGILPEATFAEGALQIDQGALVALFSDGVTEAESATGEMFEEARVMEALGAEVTRAAADALAALVSSVDRFSLGREQADDISVIVIRRKG